MGRIRKIVKPKLKIKIIDFHDKHALNTLKENEFDLVIIANKYEQEFKVIHNGVMEFNSSHKLNLVEINDYIRECYDAYNNVSDLNFHNASTNRSWI